MQKEKFEELVAQAGEHFEDYLVIVRTPNGFMWKNSDTTWGIGAVTQYIHDTEDTRRFELFNALRREE